MLRVTHTATHLLGRAAADDHVRREVFGGRRVVHIPAEPNAPDLARGRGSNDNNNENDMDDGLNDNNSGKIDNHDNNNDNDRQINALGWGAWSKSSKTCHHKNKRGGGSYVK